MKLQTLKTAIVPVLSRAKVKVLDAKAGTTQRTRGRKWMATRLHVLKTAVGACAQCGRVHRTNEVDHITPLEQGGTDDESNLQVLCHDCHAEKSAREQRARLGLT